MQCATGFLLSRNFTCVRMYCVTDSRDRCLQCIRGYTFDNRTLRCVPSNCQNYTANFSDCLVCRPGFYRENGTCLDIYCDIA